MGPLSRFTRSSGVLGDTYGRSVKEVGNKMMNPLRGKPYGVSYQKNQQFFGSPRTGRKQIRW